VEEGKYDSVQLTKLVKWFKYHLTLPLARRLQSKSSFTTLPIKPDGPDPLSGSLKNLFFLLSKGKSSIEFCWSLFSGVKRGCGKVPEAFVNDALESHKKKLCET